MRLSLRRRTVVLTTLAALATAASGAAGYGEMPTTFQMLMLVVAVLTTVGLAALPAESADAPKKLQRKSLRLASSHSD
ncbi:hypothetical protein GCM10009827_116670 [Dactylosporangium maewongense]|uniref:Secreted protein n=1 Tax=Dactylosporangium maewongense TaxID=634393 RepID=A0ABN2DDP1_9ACTN